MRYVIRWAAVGLLVALVALVSGCSLFNSPPIASFSWTPSDPISRSDVQFSDDSMDEGGMFGGGGIVSWNWDFGDSDSSSSENPTHEYERSGIYTVRLTVRDAAGEESTTSKTITIRPSLSGTWSGTLDNNGIPLGLTLNIQHSASGGIGGTGSWGGLTFAIMSASLTSNQVTLVFLGNRVLTGSLDYTERNMSGTWSLNGVIGFGWNVMLQGG